MLVEPQQLEINDSFPQRNFGYVGICRDYLLPSRNNNVFLLVRGSGKSRHIHIIGNQLANHLVP